MWVDRGHGFDQRSFIKMHKTNLSGATLHSSGSTYRRYASSHPVGLESKIVLGRYNPNYPKNKKKHFNIAFNIPFPKTVLSNLRWRVIMGFFLYIFKQILLEIKLSPSRDNPSNKKD